MARKKKGLHFQTIRLNPITLDLGDVDIQLGSGRGTFRRYDKYDAMRDEENRERWAAWWDKKSDGEKQLWVGGGFSLVGLVIWAALRTKASGA